MDVIIQKSAMKYIKFYRYLIPFWKTETAILFLNCFTMALSLINPYLAKLVIDKAYGNRDTDLFIKLVALGAFLFILTSLLGVLNGYLSHHVSLRVNLNLKRAIFRKLQKLPYRFFQNTAGGENLYKINYDLERVSQLISSGLPQMISLLPKLVFILIIAFHLNFRMALFALALTPFSYIVPVYFNRKLTGLQKTSIENSQGLFKRAHETLSHMRLVKTSGTGIYELKRYLAKLIDNTRFELAKTRVQTKKSLAGILINRGFLGLVIFYGGYQVTKGEMTLGSLTAITLYLNQLSGLQGSLAQFFQQASFGRISCERLDAILESCPDIIENADAKKVIFSKGAIEFKGAAFEYGPDKPVLTNLSFAVPGGSNIALVGPSGCGKTTIVNLITRLYDLGGGQILIDGRDVRDMSSFFFHAQIGVAMQEPSLWGDTIENNIKYGNREANPGEVAEAAKIACIDDFINGLPKKYGSFMGEGGCKISEGQKQRIAIARAVIKRPRILILDEAMSAIDSETEDRIIANIRKELKHSTIIIISHRLATIEKMDRVYFLISPSAMEIDSHNDLMRRNFKYNDLFASQAAIGSMP